MAKAGCGKREGLPRWHDVWCVGGWCPNRGVIKHAQHPRHPFTNTAIPHLTTPPKVTVQDPQAPRAPKNTREVPETSWRSGGRLRASIAFSWFLAETPEAFKKPHFPTCRALNPEIDSIDPQLLNPLAPKVCRKLCPDAFEASSKGPVKFPHRPSRQCRNHTRARTSGLEFRVKERVQQQAFVHIQLSSIPLASGAP